MTESQRWAVKCQDPADGSGDIIIDLPPNLLASLRLSIGDVLTIEVMGSMKRSPRSATVLAGVCADHLGSLVISRLLS